MKGIGVYTCTTGKCKTHFAIELADKRIKTLCGTRLANKYWFVKTIQPINCKKCMKKMDT